METDMTGILQGRVAIVTGAGRGLGREHALELARHGAKVVVNDLGTSNEGEGLSDQPAHEVVRTIRAAGGEAVANGADVADFDAAREMVEQAIETFGGLDILVNNAGFVRDRMLVNTSEEEWDAVIRVHLKGHFAPMRHAAAYWRSESKAARTRAARIINTTSGAGLQGSIGQGTYSAAKAGIAGLTLVAAAEMGRYGVTVNAIALSARTRMTEGPFADKMAAPGLRVRRHAPGQRLARGRLAGQRGRRRRDRPRGRDRGRADLRRERLGPRTRPRPRRALERGGRRRGAARPAAAGPLARAGVRRVSAAMPANVPSNLPAAGAPAGEWLGVALGERTVSWTDRDPILFALAVGARPDQLDLIFEERLRVLPSFALTLAQWAPDVLGGAGAFDVGNALHGSQVLESRAPMPASGELTMKASVSAVWDKGSAAVYDVTVESDFFLATWSLFAPGRGGFGGERGPGRPAGDRRRARVDGRACRPPTTRRCSTGCWATATTSTWTPRPPPASASRARSCTAWRRCRPPRWCWPSGPARTPPT